MATMGSHKNEELQHLRKLVMKLAVEIDVKNMKLIQMEEKYNEMSAILKKMDIEKQILQQDHDRGLSCCIFFNMF